MPEALEIEINKPDNVSCQSHQGFCFTSYNKLLVIRPPLKFYELTIITCKNYNVISESQMIFANFKIIFPLVLITQEI